MGLLGVCGQTVAGKKPLTSMVTHQSIGIVERRDQRACHGRRVNIAKCLGGTLSLQRIWRRCENIDDRV
ncbi:hypothetical protein SAMN03159423_1689 [Bradyrhizobium sp. NFR13]|nr:hypothetical protein SAMN03159423_1689 [Bradyrhizobium sp. NFR13]